MAHRTSEHRKEMARSSRKRPPWREIDSDYQMVGKSCLQSRTVVAKRGYNDLTETKWHKSKIPVNTKPASCAGFIENIKV